MRGKGAEVMYKGVIIIPGHEKFNLGKVGGEGMTMGYYMECHVHQVLGLL